ncbi:MAG: bifunctional DNA-formamidopyrimidine glycosylase/DNA-(apurinic or apyrimidinic site) lyase [Actinobacteria bacterium]|nr:bifunctional DNA-formamidopyrimidine glycosylase/DNA-(apurinic or apyrimidinic site) lyase [Actinomycetota bacterium]
MPELPEVEVVRRDLDPVVVGRTVVAVTVGRDRAVRREASPRAYVDALTGRTVAATARVGKFLVVHLADPVGPVDPPDGDAGAVVVVHLGMSGQLRVADDAAEPRLPHTHVVWHLDDGREVRFVDPRTFGQTWCSRLAGDARPVALAHLGPDALDGLGLGAGRTGVVADACAGRKVAIKLRLMDQTALAGLGNIYTDEILFRAGVAPHRPAGSLTAAEVDAVATVTPTVLAAAIAARGSSLRDAQYVDATGRPGTYQEQHAVHARAGAPCPACGRPIVRLRMGGRYASYCAGCQR